MPDPASLEIANALNLFLSNGGISLVYVARGSTYPPPQASLVGLPRLWVVLAGDDQMEMDCPGQPRQISIKKGDAVFIPANCWNKPAWSRRVTVLTLLFGKSQTGINLLSQHRKGEMLRSIESHLQHQPNSPMTGMVDAMTNLPVDGSSAPVDRLLAEALLHGCLQLMREPAQQGGRADKTFRNIAMYLQENYHLPLTRESVAEHFRVSPNHVSRLFRMDAAMGFVDYLSDIRLERAKYLLRHHDRTLGEIGISCGFSDVAYFCRVFKQKIGVTPTEYRLRKPKK